MAVEQVFRAWKYCELKLKIGQREFLIKDLLKSLYNVKFLVILYIHYEMAWKIAKWILESSLEDI